jgi:hypothetical protein
MFGVLSVVSVVAGSALAFTAKCHPSRIEALETCAGAFLILGFGLLGSAIQQLA